MNCVAVPSPGVRPRGFTAPRGSALLRACAAIAVLTTLLGCGDDSSVRACFGDAVFCATAFDPIARAGADQTVAAGDAVTLDGSGSTGGGGSIKSFAWVQTGGAPVALTDADTAKASFVAPNVAATADLTFKLTVVNQGGNADSSSTIVTIEPSAAAALASALALFGGALQPSLGGTIASPPMTCQTATAELADDAAAAQAGLFLAARSLAIANGSDTGDASAFFDTARAMTNTEPDGVGGIAGQIETFGFMLLGSLAAERDPALHDAVVARLADAPAIDDPAALLAGRAGVVDSDGVRIQSVADPTGAHALAVATLLAARTTCPTDADALQLSAAGLRVIAAMSNPDE